MNLNDRYELEPWQIEAIDAWWDSAPPQGARHGIFDVFTGAGKTVLAIGAMVRAFEEDPNFKFAVVMPTVALAKQWVSEIPKVSTCPAGRVGMVGGTENDSFETHDVLVFVLASARTIKGGRSRLAREVDGRDVMLVVDECHKAGADGAAKMFDAQTKYRLGLSATPRREEVDRDGLPVPLEKQLHGLAIGPVCYRLSFAEGVRLGMLPRFQIHHHGISLSSGDVSQHDALCRKATQCRNDYEHACGGRTVNYLYCLQHSNQFSSAMVAAAKKLQAAYLARKDFLYRAPERLRVAKHLLLTAWNDSSGCPWQDSPPDGALCFNERIGDDSDDGSGSAAVEQGAEGLYKELKRKSPPPFGKLEIDREHSGRSPLEREQALKGFKAKEVDILVSVKALQEGIDVPDVGMGISVASTSSARQRIQTMGRILRAKRNEVTGRRLDPMDAPIKQLHLLYVKGTADEEVYRKMDWDLGAGDGSNCWWQWAFGDESPSPGAPLKPKNVSEEDAWERIKEMEMPQHWDGPIAGLNLTHRAGGVDVVATGAAVHNAGELIDLLEDGEKAGAIVDARGRFQVTPTLGVVLKWGPSDVTPSEKICWTLGKPEEFPRWDADEGGDDDGPGRVGPDNGSDGPDEDGGHRANVAAIFDEIDTGGGGGGDDDGDGDGGDGRDDGDGDGGDGRDGGRANNKQFWYVLIQHACLGAVSGDVATLDAAKQCLATRGNKAGVSAAKDAARYLLSANCPAPNAAIPQTQINLMIEYAAQAFVHERFDLLQSALEAFRPTVKQSSRARRKAILNCLEILAGNSRKIVEA